MMKKKIRLTLGVLVIIGLLPLPTLAGLSMRLYGREDNSMDLQPPLNDGSDDSTVIRELKINKLDCEEASQIDITFYIDVDGDTLSSSKKIEFYWGTGCSSGTTENCTALGKDFDIGTVSKPSIALSTLLATNDCTTVTSGETKIWAGVDDDDGNTSTWSEPVTITWDTAAPATPTGLEASFGENKAALTWSGDGSEEDGGADNSGSTDDIDGFRVLYWSGTAPDNDTDSDSTLDTDSETAVDAGPGMDGGIGLNDFFARADGASTTCPEGGPVAGSTYEPGAFNERNITGGDFTSATVTGLTNDVSYKFALVAYDEHYNFSKLSNVVCTTPGEVPNFWDHCAEAGCQGGKFCFVATASFGSYNHPTVKILRQFRDKFLEPLPGGPWLIQTYYRIGPRAAAFIEDRPRLRSATKIALSAFATMTIPLSVLGPQRAAALSIAFWVIVLSLFAVFRHRRKKAARAN